MCLGGMIWCIIGMKKTHNLMIRNNLVYTYRAKLITRCYPNSNLSSRLISKYTYDEMLYSSKPLEDEYWFTNEEIEEINKQDILKYI